MLLLTFTDFPLRDLVMKQFFVKENKIKMS